MTIFENFQETLIQSNPLKIIERFLRNDLDKVISDEGERVLMDHVQMEVIKEKLGEVNNLEQAEIVI